MAITEQLESRPMTPANSHHSTLQIFQLGAGPTEAARIFGKACNNSAEVSANAEASKNMSFNRCSTSLHMTEVNCPIRPAAPTGNASLTPFEPMFTGKKKQKTDRFQSRSHKPTSKTHLTENEILKLQLIGAAYCKHLFCCFNTMKRLFCLANLLMM